MKAFNFIVVACVLVAGMSVGAQHSDIEPAVENGRIVTNGRVFGYDFGEIVGDPYFSTDPGFSAGMGALPAGSQLRFNIVDGTSLGLSGNLRYWNGVGDVSFGAMPSGETLRLALGAQSRTASAATGEVAGFSLGTVGGSGSLHVHLNSFLQGADGNADPSDGFPPAEGIYLVGLELVSSDAGLADSLPFFVVYNNGLSEAAHDRALEYVSGVPEPSVTWVIGSLAMLRLLRRRRR
jgi:hypothetical protein